MPNSDSWNSNAKKEEKKKYPGYDLTSIMTESGTIRIEHDEQSHMFCNKMQNFIETY